MLRARRFKRPNVATIVIAVLAILVVGGGTATAAKLITGQDIKNSSVTGQDIKNHSLGERDLSGAVRNKLNTTRAGSSAVGPAGPKGDKGDTGPQGAAAPANGGLPSGFFVTNNTVGMTLSGIMFGTYAEGGAAGGSLYYGGLNGKKLSAITKLLYTVEYSTDDDAPIGTPYLRVFLNNDTDDVIFDGTKCATVTPAEDTPLTFDVTSGDVRFSDDGCAGIGPDQQPWTDVVAAHGNDVISGIYVTTGFTGGQNLRAWLSDLTVNNEQFHFGA